MESQSFPCPRLGGQVELTEERRAHVVTQHSADHESVLENLGATLLEPDIVWQSRDNARELLVARAFDLGSGTKHIVVIVVRQELPARLWIVTAFVARRLPGGQRWNAI